MEIKRIIYRFEPLLNLFPSGKPWKTGTCQQGLQGFLNPRVWSPSNMCCLNAESTKVHSMHYAYQNFEIDTCTFCTSTMFKSSLIPGPGPDCVGHNQLKVVVQLKSCFLVVIPALYLQVIFPCAYHLSLVPTTAYIWKVSFLLKII